MWVMRILFIVTMIIVLTACAYHGSGRLDMKGSDFVYSYDQRTNLCFASVGITHPDDMRITQFSMTNVPCNEQLIAVASQPSNPYIAWASK